MPRRRQHLPIAVRQRQRRVDPALRAARLRLRHALGALRDGRDHGRGRGRRAARAASAACRRTCPRGADAATPTPMTVASRRRSPEMAGERARPAARRTSAAPRPTTPVTAPASRRSCSIASPRAASRAPGARVVDLGTGTGSLARLFAGAAASSRASTSPRRCSSRRAGWTARPASRSPTCRRRPRPPACRAASSTWSAPGNAGTGSIVRPPRARWRACSCRRRTCRDRPLRLASDPRQRRRRHRADHPALHAHVAVRRPRRPLPAVADGPSERGLQRDRDVLIRPRRALLARGVGGTRTCQRAGLRHAGRGRRGGVLAAS